MKTLEIDDELYQYIASNTKFIGESATDILRRLLNVDQNVEPLENNTDQASVVATDIPADEQVKEPIGTEQVDTKNSVKTEKQINDEINRQSIFDLVNKEELATQRGAVGRFLLILSNLYRVQPKQFDAVLDIRGRDRLYFSNSEEALLKAGSSTKPKQIPETDFWVITNSNTTKKKSMLTNVATVLGYSKSDVEKIRDLL
ncbi:replication initiation negative regulator SeqA [Thalassotalea crassostreae]|uniref:replication initiation negative regulator SeqA n=1 Tax=Thalassotalea crassostreae TaxID=1763536 RepID=UPI00083923E2|nr:replication initiation negative regulator SeqA [Thalassotalea crassostreae]